MFSRSMSDVNAWASHWFPQVSTPSANKDKHCGTERSDCETKTLYYSYIYSVNLSDKANLLWKGSSLQMVTHARLPHYGPE